MSIRYEFWLKQIDYTVKTKGGDWGTDSTVSLQVLRNRSDKWEVVSDKWVEQGDSDRLDAGKTESFTRSFAQPISLGASNDGLWYRKVVRFRFVISGSDAWSPADIVITPTFQVRDWNGSALVEPLAETWDYNPDTWILSTDPADGKSKDSDGNPATLTLRY